MKSVTITINLPDNAEVVVNGGAASNKPFVEKPAPPKPAGYCPMHDTEWRLVPGGTSKKTGKPYNPFWACPERGCNEKPPRDDQAVVDVSEPMPF